MAPATNVQPTTATSGSSVEMPVRTTPTPARWGTANVFFLTLPTALAGFATAFDRPPLLNEGLSELPQPNLRAVFDSLHLQLAFQPRRKQSMWS